MKRPYPHVFPQRLALFMLSGLLLAGCDKNPFSKDTHASQVEGSRIAVLGGSEGLEASDSLEGVALNIPARASVSAWPQDGGTSDHHGMPLELALNYDLAQSTQAGKGDDWNTTLIAAPVASTTQVFALDGAGNVSAHSLDKIAEKSWVTHASMYALPDGLNGGGLAIDDAAVYVTTADGTVSALEASSGKILWQYSMDMPIRSAPTLTEKGLLVVTASSQLYMLDARHGTVVWRHSGIQENARLMGTVSPAYTDGTVVAVYPSGEVYAINAEDGKVLWTDSLLLPQRTSAMGTFSGVGGMPIIQDGIAFSISSNGLLIANQLATGLRMWEQPISSNNTPWALGNYLFIITTSGQLVCVQQSDGRIAWVAPLDGVDLSKNAELQFKGPYLINDQLLVIRSDGTWQLYDPQNGKLAAQHSMRSTVYSAAAFTPKAMFLSGADASLMRIE